MEKSWELYQGKRIIIFGGGAIGRRMIEILKSVNHTPYLVTDNNPELWETEVSGICVKAVADVLLMVAQDPEHYIFLICSVYINEISGQIRQELGDMVSISTHDNFSSDLLCSYSESEKQRYHIDYNKEVGTWTRNILSEVEFWFCKSRDEAGFIERRYGGDKVLDYPYIQKKVSKNDTVLDVGCGLVSNLGQLTAEQERYHLVPVDPLAYYYKKIIDRYSTHSRKEEMYANFGMFEFLSYDYGTDIADVIFVGNALDHCIDPIKGILECIKVLKKDTGELVLFHFLNEGEKANYGGLHQWNLSVDQGDLIIWNPKNYININKLLKGFADIEVSVVTTKHLKNNREASLARIRKTADFDAEALLGISDKSRMMASTKELMALCSTEEYCRDYLKLTD